MMEKINHNCIICGVGYYHCNSCSQMKSFIPWRRIACSTECYQVYLAFLEYRDETRDPQKFAEQVDWIGFEIEKLPDNIKKVYDLGKLK